PRQLRRARDPDPRAANDLRPAVAGEQFEGRPVKRETVELARHAERLAETARPAAEQAWVVEAAPLAHRIDAVRRLERAHEHRVGHALVLADEVQAPVDPVRAVYVG